MGKEFSLVHFVFVKKTVTMTTMNKPILSTGVMKLQLIQIVVYYAP